MGQPVRQDHPPQRFKSAGLRPVRTITLRPKCQLPCQWAYSDRSHQDRRTSRLPEHVNTVSGSKAFMGSNPAKLPTMRLLINHDARFRSGANWCAIAAGAALSEWRVFRPKRAKWWRRQIGEMATIRPSDRAGGNLTPWRKVQFVLAASAKE